MAIGPAQAGPICLFRDIRLDGGPKAPHRGPAEHAVTRLTELVPELCGDLFSSEHVLPWLDRFVAGGRKVGLRWIVEIHVPASAGEASPFRNQRHRLEVLVAERKKHSMIRPDVLCSAPLAV